VFVVVLVLSLYDDLMPPCAVLSIALQA